MGLSIHIGASPYVAAELCFNSEVPLAGSLQAHIENWQGRVGKVKEDRESVERRLLNFDLTHGLLPLNAAPPSRFS
jgi:hypothetical protein